VTAVSRSDHKAYGFSTQHSRDPYDRIRHRLQFDAFVGQQLVHQRMAVQTDENN
jgi:hypothetical protein